MGCSVGVENMASTGSIVLLEIALVGVLILISYTYWRFIWFFRDPERTICDTQGAILSPADGTVIYVKRVTESEPPVSLKKGRSIPLDKFIGAAAVQKTGYLIGIFMHPTSVHVNRAPISGVVRGVEYTQGSNLPMTLTWWRTNLRIRPFEADATHLLQNERNTVHISGAVDVIVVQIADIYVNRIECRVNKGESVDAGQRIGMIRFGSQVDLFIAQEERVQILAQVGDKVKAGEAVLAKHL